MKSIIYVLIAVFAGSILFTALPQTCNQPKKNITIQCVNDRFSADQLNISSKIIESRLNDFGIAGTNINVDEATGSIQITMNTPNKDANLTFLMLSKGNIEFFETVDRLSLIEKLDTNSKLHSLMEIPNGSDKLDRFSGIFGFCKPQNKEKVTRFLSEHYTGQPEIKLNFLWSGMPNSDGNYILYLLANKPAIDKTGIKDTEVKIPENNESPNLLITFDNEGAKLWSDVTRRNIGKTISITLDKQVLQSPKVMAEIKGGKAMISGNFTLEDVNLINALANNQNLPLSFRQKE